MNNTVGERSGKTKAMVRPGLLARLKRNSGIDSDDAFAAAIGTSRSTLVRVRDRGEEPSMAFAIGVAKAFGLGLGEIVTWEDKDAERISA
ncbi:transcriptional regulator [Rhodococcus rhodochrous]|uniref:transcriptional regulator n=1 Tax=Rhodococcus rhodochrous TaxID=1829 RepID=UPI00177BA728|nr:transcriptional regulator [Rhodococcus rhodochrous]